MTLTTDQLAGLVSSYLFHRPGCGAPVPATFRGSAGDVMLGCQTCRAAYPLDRLRSIADRQEAADKRRAAERVHRTVTSTPRYVLACVRCDASIRLHRPRPIVPLCAGCKEESR